MTSSDKPFLTSKKARLCVIGVAAIVFMIGLALWANPKAEAWSAIGLACMSVSGIVGIGAGVQGGVDMVQARKE